MSISQDKSTVVAQLALFKSLGDMSLGEESELNCHQKSTMEGLVLLGLEKEKQLAMQLSGITPLKIWGSFSCQNDDYGQICWRLVSRDQRHSTQQDRLPYSQNTSFSSLVCSCPIFFSSSNLWSWRKTNVLGLELYIK